MGRRGTGLVAGLAAGSVGLVLVGALLVRGGGDGPSAQPDRLITPTTIVSAAADLLGRATTTTAPPAPSTTAWLVTTTAPPTTTTTPAPPAPLSARSVAGAERAAQAFADAMNARDCDALVALFSASTRELLGDTDELCAGLTGQDLPTITVGGPARATGRGAAVTLVAGDEREDLFLVEESGRWLVDLLG